MTRGELAENLISLGFSILPGSITPVYTREKMTVSVEGNYIVIRHNGKAETVNMDCLCIVNGSLCRSLGWVPIGIGNLERRATICLIEPIRKPTNLDALHKADIDRAAEMLSDMISDLGKVRIADPYSRDSVKTWLRKEAGK